MAHNVDDWLHALQQVMPRGKAWPRELNANLTKFLRAFAARLSRVEGDADSLLEEMRPETTTQLLTDWEEYLGLPECQPLSSTISARRRDAAEKHHRKGGLAPGRLRPWLQIWGLKFRSMSSFRTTACEVALLPCGLSVTDGCCRLSCSISRMPVLPA